MTSEVASVRENIDQLNQQALKLLFSDPDYAISVADQAVELSKEDRSEDPYTHGLAEAYLIRGRIWMQLADYQNTLSDLFRSLSLFEIIGDRPKIGYALCYLGVAYSFLGDYPNGLQYLYRALDQARTASTPMLEAEALNDIGFNYVVMGQPADSLPFLLKSLEILRKGSDQMRLGWTLDSLCRAYLGLEQFDEALHYGLECIRVGQELEDWSSVTEYLVSVGQVYQQQGHPDRALEYLNDAVRLAQKYNYRMEYSRAMQAIGEFYCVREAADLALPMLHQAFNTAEEIKSRELIIDCCRSLMKVYKKLHNFEQALVFSERYESVKKEIFNAEADRRMKNLQVLHQLSTARKEAEIFQLKYIALQREITERKKAQDRLEVLANTDDLTKLMNRRCFFEVAEDEVSRCCREQSPLAITLLDLDHFKNINDTYGHIVGDMALASIADCIRDNFRKADIASRFGGDEFVILLADTTPEAAEEAAERLRRKVEKQFISVNGAALRLTASLGVATCKCTEEIALERLLELADKALYRAKAAGRNRIVLTTDKE